jgi:hypothetical protein
VASAEIHIPPSALSYEAALEGLTRIDERQIGAGNFPSLYRSGVRYRREPRDVWRHAVDVFRSGVGDCEDLAAIRVAQLRVSGADPEASVMVYQSGLNRYHAIVRRGDGTTEDPSRILGMGRKVKDVQHIGDDDNQDSSELDQEPENFGETPEAAPPADLDRPRRARPAAAAPPAAAARKRRRKRRIARFARLARRFVLPVTPREAYRGARAFVGVGADPEPNLNTVTFDLYKSGRGWSGILRLPTSTGRAMFLQTSPSPNKARAAAKGVNLAKMAASSKAVQALMPPQARAALAVLRSPVGAKLAKGLFKKFG